MSTLASLSLLKLMEDASPAQIKNIPSPVRESLLKKIINSKTREYIDRKSTIKEQHQNLVNHNVFYYIFYDSCWRINKIN